MKKRPYKGACFGVLTGVIWCIFLLTTSSIRLTNITNSTGYELTHVSFDSGDSVLGHVTFKEGFSVSGGPGNIFLDIDGIVYGGIDLGSSNILTLSSDLYLGSNATFLGESLIQGEGHTLFLTGNMDLTSDLTVRGSLVIDGNGNILDLNNASIRVEAHSTLTLRNFTVNVGDHSSPFAASTSNGGGILAFDNIEICQTGYNPSNLIQLNPSVSGEFLNLFFHNLVVLRGASDYAYEYNAEKDSFIAPCSTLLVDYGTTFSYAPLDFEDQRIQMLHETSNLYLEGSKLALASDWRLTVGKIFVDNKVELNTGSNTLFLGDGVYTTSNTELVILAGARLELVGTLHDDTA